MHCGDHDLFEPVYNEYGGFSGKYRRFVDGYKSVWEYDRDKQEWNAEKKEYVLEHKGYTFKVVFISA